MPRQRRRTLPARLAGWVFSILLAFVAFSLLWVIAYRFINPPLTWPMARDAVDARHVEHHWAPLHQIATVMPRAVIGAEDAEFCNHSGFNLAAMQAAARKNAAGKKLRGGSTISQQTAKNAFLWPGRSYIRKGLEAWFTMLIELVWDKPRIMEVYLNIAKMGPGIYGVQAAARHYFGVDAADLSPQQASRLAAILPQPIKRDAGAPGRYVKRYARHIEKRARVVKREGIDACLT